MPNARTVTMFLRVATVFTAALLITVSTAASIHDVTALKVSEDEHNETNFAHNEISYTEDDQSALGLASHRAQVGTSTSVLVPIKETKETIGPPKEHPTTQSQVREVSTVSSKAKESRIIQSGLSEELTNHLKENIFPISHPGLNKSLNRPSKSNEFTTNQSEVREGSTVSSKPKVSRIDPSGLSEGLAKPLKENKFPIRQPGLNKSLISHSKPKEPPTTPFEVREGSTASSHTKESHIDQSGLSEKLTNPPTQQDSPTSHPETWEASLSSYKLEESSISKPEVWEASIVLTNTKEYPFNQSGLGDGIIKPRKENDFPIDQPEVREESNVTSKAKESSISQLRLTNVLTEPLKEQESPTSQHDQRKIQIGLLKPTQYHVHQPEVWDASVVSPKPKESPVGHIGHKEELIGPLKQKEFASDPLEPREEFTVPLKTKTSSTGQPGLRYANTVLSTSKEPPIGQPDITEGNIGPLKQSDLPISHSDVTNASTDLSQPTESPVVVQSQNERTNGGTLGEQDSITGQSAPIEDVIGERNQEEETLGPSTPVESLVDQPEVEKETINKWKTEESISFQSEVENPIIVTRKPKTLSAIQTWPIEENIMTTTPNEALYSTSALGEVVFSAREATEHTPSLSNNVTEKSESLVSGEAQIELRASENTYEPIHLPEVPPKTRGLLESEQKELYVVSTARNQSSDFPPESHTSPHTDELTTPELKQTYNVLPAMREVYVSEQTKFYNVPRTENRSSNVQSEVVGEYEEITDPNRTTALESIEYIDIPTEPKEVVYSEPDYYLADVAEFTNSIPRSIEPTEIPNVSLPQPTRNVGIPSESSHSLDVPPKRQNKVEVSPVLRNRYDVPSEINGSHGLILTTSNGMDIPLQTKDSPDRSVVEMSQPMEVSGIKRAAAIDVTVPLEPMATSVGTLEPRGERVVSHAHQYVLVTPSKVSETPVGPASHGKGNALKRLAKENGHKVHLHYLPPILVNVARVGSQRFRRPNVPLIMRNSGASEVKIPGNTHDFRKSRHNTHSQLKRNNSMNINDPISGSLIHGRNIHKPNGFIYNGDALSGSLSHESNSRKQNSFRYNDDPMSGSLISGTHSYRHTRNPITSVFPQRRLQALTDEALLIEDYRNVPRLKSTRRGINQESDKNIHAREMSHISKNRRKKSKTSNNKPGNQMSLHHRNSHMKQAHRSPRKGKQRHNPPTITPHNRRPAHRSLNSRKYNGFSPKTSSWSRSNNANTVRPHPNRRISRRFNPRTSGREGSNPHLKGHSRHSNQMNRRSLHTKVVHKHAPGSTPREYYMMHRDLYFPEI